MAYPLIIVTGPTASGKSALAVSLALSISGEIINLDSVQIYRGLDIGSAKVPLSERQGVPHHLLDIRDPNENFDAAEFIIEAEAKIKEIEGRGRTPILVGGTTLYITALLYGLAEMPRGDPQTRRELEGLESEVLHERLRIVDPASASKIHPHDRYRVIRALETYYLTGNTASEIRASHGQQCVKRSALIIALCPARETLYHRINERSKALVAGGILEETKSILEKYGRVKALSSLGYQQALDYLDGTTSLEALPLEIAQYTRRYAKRQMTYLRNEPKKRGWGVLIGEADKPAPLDRSALVSLIQDDKKAHSADLSSVKVIYVTP